MESKNSETEEKNAALSLSKEKGAIIVRIE